METFSDLKIKQTNENLKENFFTIVKFSSDKDREKVTYFIGKIRKKGENNY